MDTALVWARSGLELLLDMNTLNVSWLFPTEPSHEASSACQTGFGGLKEFEPAPLGELAFLSISVLFYFILFGWAAQAAIFEPLSIELLGHRQTTETYRSRFQKSGWMLMIHIITIGHGTYFMYLGSTMMPYANNVSAYWDEWPHQTRSSFEANGMPLFYALHIGMYAYQILTLLKDGSEHSPENYTMLVIHHTMTIVLAITSWYAHFTRIGSYAMILHNVTDLLWQLTKFLHYAGKFNPLLELYSDLSFVAFALSFAWLRLYWIPMRILYPIASSSCGMTTCFASAKGLDTWENCAGVDAWRFFLLGMSVLFVIQIQWAVKLSSKIMVNPREFLFRRNASPVAQVGIVPRVPFQTIEQIGKQVEKAYRATNSPPTSPMPKPRDLRQRKHSSSRKTIHNPNDLSEHADSFIEPLYSAPRTRARSARQQPGQSVM